MLQEWKAMEKPEEEEIKARLVAAKEKLAKQQLLILLLAGILLLVVVSPVPDQKDPEIGYLCSWKAGEPPEKVL